MQQPTARGALGAAAAVALTLGGMTPAYAATIPVGPDQVAPVEIGGDGSAAGYNYLEWHIGSAKVGETQDEAIGNASFNFDNPAGITLLPRSVSGAVNLQISGLLSTGDATGTWTTLRPVAAHGTVASALDIDQGVGTGPAYGTPFSRSGLFEDMGNFGTFQLYGVGVVSDADPPSVVSSITFGGNTYDFTTAAAPTPGVPTPGAPAPTAPTPPAKIDTAA